jgi:hypothetical protein
LAVTGATAWADEIDDEVGERYRQTMADWCDDAAIVEPEVHTVKYPDPVAGSGVMATARIYQFFCFSGAYNAAFVFFTHSEFGGVQQLFFAVPEFDVVCQEGFVAGMDCVPVDIAVTGMTTVGELVNPEFDPATRTMTSLICWRGLCDASERGTWVFEDGRFVLATYEVDAAYDEEINLILIVDFTP